MRGDKRGVRMEVAAALTSLGQSGPLYASSFLAFLGPSVQAS